MNANDGLKEATIRGAIWTFSMRWGVKLIGLFSTMILARLLPPSEFGVIAMAMLAVGLIDIIASFDLGMAVIQKKEVTREHYDTAWTLRILQVTVIALLLVIASPYAADFFDEPRVTGVLWLLAGTLFLSGFANIGVLDFRKKLQFHKEFQLAIGAKLTSFFVTIILAFWLGDYWALALGITSAYLSSLVLSYTMHPFRPKFSVSKLKELFSFSQWLMLRNIALFLETKADQLFIGRVSTTHTIGLYNTAAGLAELPSNELAYPLARVLFPVMSTIQDQPERLKKGYLLALNGVNSVTLPAGIGLALLAHLAIPVLLGEQWLDAIPFLQALAIFGVLRVSYSASDPLLLAIGKPKLASHLTWIHVGVFFTLATYLYPSYGIEGIISAKIATAGLMAILYFSIIIRMTLITALDILRSLIRPVISTGLMAATILAIPPSLSGNILIDLLVFTLIGAIVYVSALFTLWRFSGREDGIEALVLHKIFNNLNS